MRSSLVAFLVLCGPALAQTPVITEVDADTVGSSDTLEFVELYDGGVGNTPLDGYTIALYIGSLDIIYKSYDLDGFSTDANGFFLLGSSSIVPPAPNGRVLGPGTLNDGAAAVALYLDDAVNLPGGTPVTDTNLVDAVVYDTDDPDDTDLLMVLTPGEPQLNENDDGDKDFDSNQRNACSLAERSTSTWFQGPATPGALPSSVGANYCAQNANSTGLVATMAAYGSVMVADNDMTLVACDLPVGSGGFGGYFLVSSAMGFIPVMQSNGFLCLSVGPTLGRYGKASQIQFPDPSGSITLDIDLTQVPQAAGVPPVTSVQPGETWYFQAWFRDEPTVGMGNNFTDGIAIAFQ